MIESKNKTFDCRGNEEADNILCMLEANSVLSQEFTNKVQNIVLAILTNLKENEEWIEQHIIKLKEEMQWLTIFSEKFINQLTGQLLLTFHRQKTLNKQKRKKIN